MKFKDNRDKKIDVRLTASEKEKIQLAAERHGMTISEFVRFACEKIFKGES